jgi:hypothetical protein
MSRQIRAGRGFFIEIDDNGERRRVRKVKPPPPHIDPDTGELTPVNEAPKKIKSLFANGKRPVKDEGEDHGQGHDKDKTHGNDKVE